MADQVIHDKQGRIWMIDAKVNTPREGEDFDQLLTTLAYESDLFAREIIVDDTISADVIEFYPHVAINGRSPSGTEVRIVGPGKLVDEMPAPPSPAPADTGSSWFDLASYFLSSDTREAVRGDIREIRLEMKSKGYGRAWIESVTAVQLVRSVLEPWGIVAKDLLVALVKWALGS